MRSIQLGPNGRTTSQLGFGCSSLMGASGKRASLATLEAAFAAGIRHFDVAPMYGYGEAESCLGEFLKRHPGAATVTTKYGIPPARNQALLGMARRVAGPVVRALPGLKSRLLQSGRSHRSQRGASLLHRQSGQSQPGAKASAPWEQIASTSGSYTRSPRKNSATTISCAFSKTPSHKALLAPSA